MGPTLAAENFTCSVSGAVPAGIVTGKAGGFTRVKRLRFGPIKAKLFRTRSSLPTFDTSSIITESNPTDTLPKLREVGFTAIAGLVPVPRSSTVRSPWSGSLLVIARDASRSPMAVGANWICKVKGVPPGGIVTGRVGGLTIENRF